MMLAIKPHDRSAWPIGGLLIRGRQPSDWLPDLQQLGLDLSTVPVYVLTAPADESVWGCLVVVPGGAMNRTAVELGACEWLQVAEGMLFIPERAALFPALAEGEVTDLLRHVPHLLHPSLGFVALTDVMDWATYLPPPAGKPVDLRKPVPPIVVPGRVHSFQVVPVDTREAIDNLMASLNELADKPIQQPLSWREELRLALLKGLFRQKPADPARPQTSENVTRPTGLAQWLSWLLKPGSQWLNDRQKDFDKLAERNQEQLVQLLTLLRENPELGLKYALPLDNDGVGRGGERGGSLFNWSVRWLDLSLFNNQGQGSRGGNATLKENHFDRLREQYNQTATELVGQGKHGRAAFVYLKLLKDPYRAAKVLEDGKLYQEAAAVYLDSLKNKVKAAECYEKGQMIDPAIALYKDLSQHEKVGDLYCATARAEQALPYYQRVIDDYLSHRQYVKAALLCQRKMGGTALAQRFLLDGWHQQADGINCLHLYLSNIADETDRHQALEALYANYVGDMNREPFLQVVQHAFGQADTHRLRLREIAYELIAAEARRRPNVLAQLNAFNPADELVGKDVVRYRSQR